MEGCIEIQKVVHDSFYYKIGDQRKIISNQNNRPYLFLYLDSLANVTETVGFGKKDLRQLDFVIQNKFENGKLIESIKYNSDYKNNISADFKTKYFYNHANQLIQEKELYYKTDSLYMQYDYEYDANGNRTKTIFDPTYYYKRVFNNQSQLQSLQQIYNDKLRWEWTYTYTDTTRIGEFKTFYNDRFDHTKKEIRTYRNGKLIEVEEKYTNRDLASSKTILYYDKLDLIIKIDFYEAFWPNMTYQLESYTEIKTKFCRQLTSQVIKRINEKIYDE